MASGKQQCAAESATRSPVKNTSPKKGGRPVTWIGGGGLNPQTVANKGVPELRALFFEVFGHPTASNNSSWLRRKLCEPPDERFGQGRSAKIRKRDQGAAIWTSGPASALQKAKRGKRLQPTEDLAGVGSNAEAPPTRRQLRPSDTGSVTADDASKRSDPAVDLVMGKLKQLALLGTAGPSTIEVFWPEGDAGGNWWPAKVLKVLPRKGKCRVLYETSESEELDLSEIVSAKHLRLAERSCKPEATDAWLPPFAGSFSDTSSQETLHIASLAEQSRLLSRQVASMAPSGGCPLIEDTKAKTVAELPSGEEEAEEQALSDLQDIMGDPVVEDCTSLPQLPDDSAKDKREQDSQWMPDFEFEAFCQPPSVKIKFESLPSLEQNAADSMMVDALDLNAISCSDASTSCGVWSPGSTQATPEFEFESCAAVAPPIPPQLPSYSVSSISMADALGSQPLQMGSAWPTAEELSRNGQLEAMKNLLQQQIAHHQAVLRQQQQLAQVPPHVPLNLLSMPVFGSAVFTSAASMNQPVSEDMQLPMYPEANCFIPFSSHLRTDFVCGSPASTMF